MEARARRRLSVKRNMGRRRSGGGNIRKAGEEKGRDTKEVRNGEFLSPKGVEGMKVVV